ncbi:FAD-dependent oxidoreductase [Chroococcidiopsis sp. CCMEE 29]|uniref:FAD-dependent oxidoreductase n=1 Tax=Chroococcidiopsis sp. CCMEE 29 TaxID=155894 RepID=UPI0020227508|nr:FAD-dependent oxidoreductase [Chroococcidiopsis sp. CCMEE 29]
MKQAYDAIVIGGGFFGCKLSLYLKQYLRRILIVEKEVDLLQRASYVNQARVHNGYHYPRSILTGLRSKVNFPKFINEYQDCVDSSFDKYYAIGKILSKVTANQFKLFCQRIDVPIEPAPQAVKKLFNYTIIEEVFRTQEYAFDAVKLKNRVLNELEAASVEIQLNSQVVKVKDLDNLGMEIFIKSENNCDSVTAKYVFNCTYSGINQILRASDLPIIPLKHELAEMALVAVPEPLKHLGITVMCGPFFSIMPFPSRGLHTLSHVRYTPHCYWQDSEDFCVDFGISPSKIPRKTNYLQMVRDAERYMPILKECRHVDSIWEVKTVLPQSEVDDSRPILFKKDQGIKNLTCILGGKIDNVYDIPDELQFLNSKESLR